MESLHCKANFVYQIHIYCRAEERGRKTDRLDYSFVYGER